MSNKLIMLLTIAIVITLVIFFVIGGGFSQKGEEMAPRQSFRVIVYSQEFFNDNNLVMRWINSNFKNEGIYEKRLDDEILVLIAGGERPDGGYSVHLKNVEVDQNNKVKVDYDIVRVPKEQPVTMAISHPHLLFGIRFGD